MKLLTLCLSIPVLLALALGGCDSGGQSGHEGRGTDQPAAGSGGSGGRGGAGPGDDMPDGSLAGSGGAGASGGGGTGFGNCEPDEDGGCNENWDFGGGRDSGVGFDDDGGTVYRPLPPDNLIAYEHVCDDSGAQGPRDCMDVCGMLHHCDAQIACNTCVQRCAASGYSETNGAICLALAIYWIDEEGCNRVQQVYRDYASCPE